MILKEKWAAILFLSSFCCVVADYPVPVYHTIIATCKAQAISVCDYLKKFSRHVLMDVRIMSTRACLACRSTLSLGLSKNQRDARTCNR